MKKYFFLSAAFAALLSLNSYAQTNTFPSSGDVGIGTTSPLNSLHTINTSSGATTIPLLIANGGTSVNTAAGVDFGIGGNGAVTIGRIVATAPGNNSGQLLFSTSSAGSLGERMRINENGDVGIGTTSPTFSVNTARFFALSGQDLGANILGEIGVGGNITGGSNYLGTFSFYNSSIGGSEKRVAVLAAQTQGATNTANLQFFTTNSGTLAEKMRIAADGNVGINIASPSEKLDVNGNIKSTGFILPTGAGSGKILTSDGSGNATWQTAAAAGWAYDGSTVGAIKKIGTTDNYALPFITNNTEWMRITTSGNVGIGTTSPSEKLSVNGNIVSKKVKVTQSGWADYVFHSSYKLPSLSEVEAYIKQHQHLKDIPSAKEVEEKGLDLGDNQAALLRKIEELTLYVIDIKKENEQMKKKITLLENRVAKKK